MQVVIPKNRLEEERACPVYLESPEWNGEALVYANWDQTVSRLLSTRAGTTYLGFLVVHKLVPMTAPELTEARRLARLDEIKRAVEGRAT
jgi:hypothetical protein